MSAGRGIRVIAASQVPDHMTIARFRSEYAEALGELFGEVLTLCAEAGLLKVDVLALDGTELAASASLAANRTLGGSRRKWARSWKRRPRWTRRRTASSVPTGAVTSWRQSSRIARAGSPRQDSPGCDAPRADGSAAAHQTRQGDVQDAQRAGGGGG